MELEIGTTGIGFWNQYTPVLTTAKKTASAQAATPRSMKKGQCCER